MRVRLYDDASDGGHEPLSPAATRRALLGLGIPVYFELLSGVVAGIIDTIWVARLGEAAVGAVAVASTLENVLLGVILMANVGTTVLIADALGGGRRAELPVAVRAAGTLWLTITPVVALGGFLLRDQVAQLLVGSGDGDVHRLAAEFFAISFPGMAVFFAQNVVDGIFKGTGDTRTPMRMALLANACILVLDPLLIYGVGGLPKMGVQGAALGMMLGRAVALGVSLVLLRRKRVGATGGETTTLHWKAALRRILGVGLPASGDFVLRMGISAALVGIVARFGEDPLAAYGIGIKLILFATMAFYALRQAGSILTARSRGSGQNADRVIGQQSLLLATVVGAGAGLVLALSGRVIMGFFSDAPPVVDSGEVLLWYLLPYLVLLAGVVGLGGVFMGGSRTRSLFWVTVLGACVQLPFAYALSSLPALGVQGVWLSMIIGTAAQYAMTVLLFRRVVGPARPSPLLNSA
ncbi:MATE family efflux transporter [Streptomyces sp. CB01373]|uniref:MATE family efflux transporter n=1 Tax=Streptomyces sp. CB01373 TaxID=2020325 RepID=UPI001F198888|nr:MATE family efflux transporter [Streptomyces sp. CB01373]